jgi:hypothetical protein
MSKKTRLALAQSAVLADVQKPATPAPLDTTIHQSLPPMSLKEALLKGNQWISLDTAIKRRDAARRILEDRFEEETCGEDYAY